MKDIFIIFFTSLYEIKTTRFFKITTFFIKTLYNIIVLLLNIHFFLRGLDTDR